MMQDYNENTLNIPVKLQDGKEKWGLFNKNGQLTTFKYDYIGDFNEGFARAKTEFGWGFLNINGKEITDFKYYSVYNFHEGLAVVYDGKYFGVIDETGKEIIPCTYSYIGSFCDGVAYSCINGEYNYIDTLGNIVSEERVALVKTKKVR